MKEKNYLTADGAKRLKKELEELKGPIREDLAKRLRAAIQQGDLSENADYITTKEEQGFIEGRIQELEYLFKNAVIIDDKERNTDIVEIGAKVTVQEEDCAPEIFFIVGPQEADPQNGKISYESPIGKSLLNHRTGDSIKIDTPEGETNFKIIKIE